MEVFYFPIEDFFFATMVFLSSSTLVFGMQSENEKIVAHKSMFSVFFSKKSSVEFF